MLLLHQVRKSVVTDFIRGTEAEKGEEAKADSISGLPVFSEALLGTLACLDTDGHKDTRKLLQYVFSDVTSDHFFFYSPKGTSA